MGFRVLDRDRHPQATGQPLCEVEGVPRYEVRRVGVGGPLRHAAREVGRPKTRPRRPIAGARKGRARRRKVNHTLHAARREFLELGAQRVDGGLLGEVDAASSQVLWGSDWHACRGDGRRECALACEELTEKKPLGIQGGNFDWWLKHRRAHWGALRSTEGPLPSVTCAPHHLVRALPPLPLPCPLSLPFLWLLLCGCCAEAARSVDENEVMPPGIGR